MILILGTPEDGCVGDALAHLRQRGHEVLVVPEAQLPDALQYKWELPSPIEAGYLQVPIQDLTGVLVRLRQTFQASLMEMDDRAYIRAEWSALLYGFLKSLPCPVVNRPRPGAGQRFPETQAVAGALRRAGFLPPPTLVTASVEAARGFFERHARRVLCAAPGYAGHYLLDGRARGSLVERGRAFRLQAVPTGRCLRVVVVGRAAFGAEAAGSELLNFSRNRGTGRRFRQRSQTAVCGWPRCWSSSLWSCWRCVASLTISSWPSTTSPTQRDMTRPCAMP
jgi:hypothetical protein